MLWQQQHTINTIVLKILDRIYSLLRQMLNWTFLDFQTSYTRSSGTENGSHVFPFSRLYYL